MIRLIPSASLTLCLVLTSCFAADGAADRVYRNGKVFTADAEGSIAQAIAIRDGRIVYVGSDEGVTRLIGSSTQVTDLAGRFLMPGLVDGHMHPLFGGFAAAEVQPELRIADNSRFPAVAGMHESTRIWM